MSNHKPPLRKSTFNPAVPNDPEPGQTCEDCGKERWKHRDGGLAYGLICPKLDPRDCPNGTAHTTEACATCGLIMDYPTAFAFADTVPIEDHHERCSKRAGMLCDCDVVNAEYTRRKAVLDDA